MPKKVTWKKGMRLSAEVFNAADNVRDESLRLVTLLSSSGKFGLFTTSKAFELSVNINNNILEVVSLNCHGITKSGKLVAIDYDSNYSNTFDTRITIPSNNNEEGYFLVVKMYDNEWREVDEMYSEAKYTFELLGENNIIDKDSLPIGYIVNQFGWRLNEIDFVPPCLYVSSHIKFVEQLERAKNLNKNIIEKCSSANNCVARILLLNIWTAAANALNRFDKERDTLTPNQLYADIQHVINSFVIGCQLDECITLENKESFALYIQKPYDTKNIYCDIEQGLSLCAEIVLKVEAVCGMVEVGQEPVESISPKAKSPKDPEPQKKGRNRWEGIEI